MGDRYAGYWNGTKFQIFRAGEPIAEEAVADLNKMDQNILELTYQNGLLRAEVARLKSVISDSKNECKELCIEVQMLRKVMKQAIAITENGKDGCTCQEAEEILEAALKDGDGGEHE